MKIYIASPYIAQQEINKLLCEKLTNAGNDVFLPESINIDAITEELKKKVAEICYRQIDRSELILVVYPFGISVSCEAGYSICQKINGKNKKLILFMNAKSDKIHEEAMLIPYIDYETDSVDGLLDYIRGLEAEPYPKPIWKLEKER